MKEEITINWKAIMSEYLLSIGISPRMTVEIVEKQDGLFKHLIEKAVRENELMLRAEN